MINNPDLKLKEKQLNILISIKFCIQSGLVYWDIRDSSTETLDRSPYPTIEKSRDASSKCDDTVVTRLTRRTNQTLPLKRALLGESPYRIPINESRL